MPLPTRFVVTLIAAPGGPPLSDALVKRAKQGLETRLSLSVESEALEAGAACDFTFETFEAERTDLQALCEYMRAELAPAPLDAIGQKAAFRRKRLLLADMDSTMIQQECIDELAAFVGLRDKVAAITERAMRGEIAFEPALRERVALLKGLDEAVIAKAIAERIVLTPGSKTLVATMRAHGARTALISGGFTAFTDRIGAAIGFDESRANRLIVENGRFAGRVGEPILGRQAKLAALIELRRRWDLRREETLAVGDGANDLDMLQEAGLGVAYRAKPAVAAAAHARIDHGDLTALLYAQGFRREEFVIAE